MDCAYVFSRKGQSSKKRSAAFISAEKGIPFFFSILYNLCKRYNNEFLDKPNCDSRTAEHGSVEMMKVKCDNINFDLINDYCFTLCACVILSVEVKRLVSPCPSHDFEDRDLREEINQDEIMSGEKFKGLHPSPTTKEMYTSAKLTRCREESLCLQHCAPLDVFCKTDQTLICKQCATLEHQDHNKCYTTGAKVRYEIFSSDGDLIQFI